MGSDILESWLALDLESSSKDCLTPLDGFLNGEMLIPGGKFGGVDFPAGLEMLMPGGRFGTGDMEIPGGILVGVLSASLL